MTTTSVRDSGLLDALLPVFRQRSGVRVQVVAVGSGAALRMGSEGNADALLTHAPAGEEALVASGAAMARVPFMENHFVIAGPAADPARVFSWRGDPSVPHSELPVVSQNWIVANLTPLRGSSGSKVRRVFDAARGDRE